MSNEQDNRRDQTRVPIELKVEYERRNSFFADYTKNISKGGTFINTETAMPIGTEFIFKLHVADIKEPLLIKGVVRWIIPVKDAEGRDPGMGIQFVYADKKEQATVEAVVKRLMVESLGENVAQKLMSKIAQGES